MKKILAIGNSHLGALKKGFELVLKGSQALECIDFAQLWETGFGYLELDGSKIVAPDFIPEKNNPRHLNLKEAWGVYPDKVKVPDLSEYDLVLVVASPSKLFSLFYYGLLDPFSLSTDIIRDIIFSNTFDVDRFPLLSPLHLRVSKVVKQICDLQKNKVVFIGAPLPVEGFQLTIVERLRAKLEASRVNSARHLENIERIRFVADQSLADPEALFKVILPPRHLLCHFEISTKAAFRGRDLWHCSGEYNATMVEHLDSLFAF